MGKLLKGAYAPIIFAIGLVVAVWMIISYINNDIVSAISSIPVGVWIFLILGIPFAVSLFFTFLL